MQRVKLQNRLKRKDIPILCEEHSKDLLRGDMALIDHIRCQKCFPPLTGWPPKMPPKAPPPPPTTPPKAS